MRILQCVTDLDPALGGAVEAARLLTIGLVRLGHTVEVLTIVPPQTEWVTRWGVPCHAAGPGHTYYCYSAQLAPWVAAHAREFDILVVHGVWRYMSVGVWRGVRGTGVPFTIYTHGMLDPYFNRFAWKRLKKQIMWGLFERKVLRDAAAVIFTCEEERAASTGNFSPFPCRAAIVNLGLEHPPKAPVVSWPAELRDKQVVLFLARFEPQKGCDTLIAAFARVAPQYPNLRLLIAGPDSIGWKAELMRLAESAGMADRILWHRPVFGITKWEFLQSADAYILPTNFENFGIAIVEALSCGVPVLISNKAAVWKQVEQCDAGFVSNNSVEGTAGILERWMATGPERRAQMSLNAARCFAQHYALEGVAQSLAELLKSCLRASP